MTDLSRRSALSLALAATAAAAAGDAASALEQPATHRSCIDRRVARLSAARGRARRQRGGGGAYVIGPEVIGGPPTLPDGRPRASSPISAPGRGDQTAGRPLSRLCASEGRRHRGSDRCFGAHRMAGCGRQSQGRLVRLQPGDGPAARPQPRRSAQSNAVPPGGRAALDICQSRADCGRNAPAVAFDDGMFCGSPSISGIAHRWGGSSAVPRRSRPSAPSRAEPTTFANNDGWHDDIADGPVRATVTFDARPIEAEPGYVAVTPPNFAPGLTGLVTMDDAVRETFQARAGSRRRVDLVHARCLADLRPPDRPAMGQPRPVRGAWLRLAARRARSRCDRAAARRSASNPTGAGGCSSCSAIPAPDRR